MQIMKRSKLLYKFQIIFYPTQPDSKQTVQIVSVHKLFLIRKLCAHHLIYINPYFTRRFLVVSYSQSIWQ